MRRRSFMPKIDGRLEEVLRQNIFFHFSFPRAGAHGSSTKAKGVMMVWSLWSLFSAFLVLWLHCDTAEAESRPFMYTSSVPILVPGKGRMNESISFPPALGTEVRQRYVLEGLQSDTYYIIHLSFLGSPSIKYNLHVTHIARHAVENLLQGEPPIAGQRHLADVNRIYVKTRQDALLFDFIGGDGGAENAFLNAGNNEKYIPVLEVHGYRDGFPHQPENWRDFRYNIRLDIVGKRNGLTMAVACNAATVVVMILFVVVFAVPWIVTAVEGTNIHSKQQRHRDFVIFFA